MQKSIVVRVGGREVMITINLLSDDKWRIKHYHDMPPARVRSSAKKLFREFVEPKEAAEYVAGLIRDGTVIPSDGHYSGAGLEVFPFPE